MDPFTHTLFGATLADTGLRRTTPLAAATLLVGVNLPDVDFVTYFVDADLSLAWRRGWTHGILAMVVLPLLLAGGMLVWDRAVRRARDATLAPARFVPLLGLACLGVWSHPTLDWLNTYGVRLLMPFSGRWFYGDTLFIIDPFLWCLLGGVVFLRHSASARALLAWAALALAMSLAVLAAPSPIAKALWFLGLTTLAILRFRPLAEMSSATGHRLARGALVLGALYVGLLMVGSRVAETEIRSTLQSQGIGPVEDLLVGPLPASPWRRDVVVVTAEGYRHGTFAWAREPRLELSSDVLPHLPDDPVVHAALEAPCLRGMAGWVRYPFVEVENKSDGHHVWLLDARYTRGRTEGFGGGHIHLDSDLEPTCDAH